LNLESKHHGLPDQDSEAEHAERSTRNQSSNNVSPISHVVVLRKLLWRGYAEKLMNRLVPCVGRYDDQLTSASSYLSVRV
jgi:hypothetical protein